MNISDTKEKILEEADYTYHRDRKVYYNQKAKKVFSSEAVKVNDEHWLRRCIEEVSSVGDWGFYFTAAPSEDIKRELIRELAPNV